MHKIMQQFLFSFFIIIASCPIKAEELNLNCEGYREITSISIPIDNSKSNTKSSKETAFVTINKNTNVFKISGAYLAATTLDQQFKDSIFMADDKEFKFMKRYKDGEIDALSSININRYNGQMEIYNAITGRSGIVIDTSKMFCKLVATKKF